MVRRARQICTRRGCRGLYDPATRTCTVCGVRPTWRWRTDRGTRTERGYDNAWLRLRNAKLHEDPLCEHCLARGETEEAVEVDHIRPFRGRDDPLRLDWANLQSLCAKCHKTKTLRQAQGG